MKDKIYHMLCADEQVQVCAIVGLQMVRRMRELHNTSRVATAALGRQLMMTSMMGSRLKNADDRVSTIIKGDGYAGSMVCTAMPGGFVKGCLQDAEVELPPTAAGKLDVAGYVGHTGKLTVVRDLGFGDPYVGVCNLVSGEIAVDFAEYFTASEQQPSLVYLGVRLEIETGEVRSAAGMLIQPLPGCEETVIETLTARSEEIAKLSAKLDEGEELLDAVNGILVGMEPKVVQTYAPEYRCDCSRERIERALISVGASELTSMIEQDGCADVSCQFCGKTYHFDRQSLTALLDAAQSVEKHDREES